MSGVELVALLEAVRGDMVRHSNSGNESALAIANMCQFAIWHLKGEPSFVERNNAMREDRKL